MSISDTVTIRMRSEQKEQIEQAAARAGLSISQWCMQCFEQRLSQNSDSILVLKKLNSLERLIHRLENRQLMELVLLEMKTKLDFLSSPMLDLGALDDDDQLLASQMKAFSYAVKKQYLENGLSLVNEIEEGVGGNQVH
jgi:uncharacterized protein (DUF1778 family)